MAETTRKRRTSSTGKKGTGSRKKNSEESFIRAEVIIISTFAFALLLMLSNFHLCGTFGEVLRSVVLGIFGSVGYIIPVLLVLGTSFYMTNSGNVKAIVKLAAAIALFVILCGMFQMMFGGGLVAEQKLSGYYNASSVSGRGGGFVGGLLVLLLGNTLGVAGTYLVLLALLVICVVCITERSVVSAVKKGKDKAYQYAREDLERRAEIHAEKKEEKKRIREEQRVRGVNLNSTKIGEMALADVQAPTEDTIRPENPADIFSGNINLPKVALEEAATEEAVAAVMEEDLPFELPDSIYAGKETSTLKEMEVVEAEDPFYPTDNSEKGVNYDGFFIPEEPKTVVTANGKIIETETEALHKKLEQKRAEREAAEEITVNEEIKKKEVKIKKKYIFPPVTLLKQGARKTGGFSESEYKETAIKLQQTLKNFGVGVTVTNISCGPSVTRYELQPEQGVKVSKIVALTDDIKLNLAAADIRIEAPIPGKSAVGIEVPNKENNMVLLRELFESEEFKVHPSKIAFAVGKDIAGQTVVTDIAKMPHLLIAGATGSGKSVCINTLIMSIIYKADPEDVKLIMVDPKVVELSVYNGIPHLMIPVVTDPKKASGALNWAVAEMTDRYKKFADYNVRDLKGYNEKVSSIEDIEDEEKPKKLPQIVIIVDELADLMMVAPGEVEDSICRLAQLARAAGIHLVIATQRPSVNVITGLIKANVPSRIAFSVSSGVDSRTIIDMNGAEKLLGKGDMLFYPSGYQKPQRVQGAFVSDQEVSQVVEFLTKQGMEPDYDTEIVTKISAPVQAESTDSTNLRDEYFIQAGRFIIEKDKASIGMLQRMFKIGFNRAARIMDQLAEAGVVGEEEGTKPRKVLMTMEEFEQMAAQEM